MTWATEEDYDKIERRLSRAEKKIETLQKLLVSIHKITLKSQNDEDEKNGDYLASIKFKTEKFLKETE